MEDDTSVTIINNIVATLEEHNKILVNHRDAFQDVYGQLTNLKEELREIKKLNSLNSSDAQFIADIIARLTAITNTVKQKQGCE
jgi:hypothetical protein